MTFKQLYDKIAEHGISGDVELLSDSGWECDSTNIESAYYNETDNELVLTRSAAIKEYPLDVKWKLL